MDYQNELLERKQLLVDTKNLFVQAGAGAGKTTSLVQRIVHSFTQGVLPKEVVSITFTNNSAEDLRKRIIEKLSEAQLNDILEHIDEMHISTIHKFCGDILRENSIYASLSPDFKILSDEEDYNRKQLVLNSFLRKMPKKVWDQLDSFNYPRYRVKIDLEGLYLALTSFIEPFPFENIYQETVTLDLDVKKEVKRNVQAIVDITLNSEDELLEIANQGKKKNDVLNTLSDIYKKGTSFNPLTRNDIDLVKEYTQQILNDHKNPFLDKEEIVSPFSGTKFRGEKKESILYYQEQISEYVFAIEKLRAEEDIKYKNSLLKVAYEVYQNYLTFLDNDSSCVSNDQMLYKTFVLLKDNKDVLDKLQNKYKHLYIDEYQDTDHIQMAIALLLTTKNDQLIGNSLYVVGDPKQSIYRFRGAEPKVYFDTKDYFINHSNTKIYDLNINFRCNSEILKWVNEKYHEIKLTNDAYIPMMTKKSNEISQAELDDQTHLLGFYQTIGTEPKDIAETVKALINNYELRRVKDDKATYRKITYKDIMILMPYHAKMDAYIKALSQYNIPTKVSGESNFEDVLEIKCFVNLLDGLINDNPNSLQASLEALRVVYEKDLGQLSFKESQVFVKERYDELKEQTKDINYLGIAYYLIEHLKYIFQDQLLEDFKINSILSKIYQMMEEVIVQDHLNSYKLIEALRTYLSKTIDTEALMDSDTNAVYLLNVHKSKGLESPIVIWVGNDKEGTERNNKVVKDNILYLTGNKVKDSLYKPLCLYDNSSDLVNSLLNEDLEERSRLEYVACTRAEEAFIFTKKDKDNKMFSSQSGIYKIHELRQINKEVKEIEDEEQIIVPYVEKEHNYLSTNPILTISSPSSKEQDSKTYTEYMSLYKKTERPKGNIVGTHMHKALELLAQKQEIDEILDYLKTSENLDELELSFLKTILKRTKEHYQELNLFNKELYPEFTFSYQNKNGEIMNGSIDLLVIDNNQALIIDYKSDEADYLEQNIFEQVLKERYLPQIDCYKEIVKDLVNVETITTKIIYYRNYQKEKEDIEIKTYKI